MWATNTEELNPRVESGAAIGVAVVGCGYWALI